MSEEAAKPVDDKTGGWKSELIKGFFLVLAGSVPAFLAGQHNPSSVAALPETQPTRQATATVPLSILNQFTLKADSALTEEGCVEKISAMLGEDGFTIVRSYGTKLDVVKGGATGIVWCDTAQRLVIFASVAPDDRVDTFNVNLRDRIALALRGNIA